MKTIKILQIRDVASIYLYCEALTDKKRKCGDTATKELTIAGDYKHYFFCAKHFSQLKDEMKELGK